MQNIHINFERITPKEAITALESQKTKETCSTLENMNEVEPFRSDKYLSETIVNISLCHTNMHKILSDVDKRLEKVIAIHEQEFIKAIKFYITKA